jgi:hypothetical protein
VAEFGRGRTREHRGVARAAREPVQCLGGIGGHGAVSGVGGQPRPAGREPSGRGAATRSARPPPQADSSGSNEPRCTRSRENWTDRPPRARHSLAGTEITVKGAPKGASPLRGADPGR